jgi:hypothetical protein
MKYTSHATIKGAPKFDVRARAEPIGVRCGLEGAARARVGPIYARIGRVPITLAVPFLGGIQTVGAVGPFDLSLEPVDLSVEEVELRCEGLVGTDGLDVGLEGGIACEMRVDLKGTLPGRVARAQLVFAEKEEHERHYEDEDEEEDEDDEE